MAHFPGETGHLAKHDDLDTYVTDNPTPLTGTISARPTVGSVPTNQVYFATDDAGGTLYKKISGAWVQLAAPVNAYSSTNANLSGSTPPAIASAGAVGSATTYAHGDHTHSGVTSVATRTGAVTLTAADIAAGTFPTGTFNFSGTLQEGGNRVYSAGNAPPYPVTSVATRTGAVTLTAADIAAGTFPAGTFTIAALTFSGLTGSVQTSRYVGATSSGAPTTGAHNQGDHVISLDGHHYICTVAGTPGTWVDAGSVGNLVTSVATRTGAVTLTAADIAAGTFPAGTFNFSGTLQEGGNRVYSAGNAPPYPVTSVATRTGAVTLTAADIGVGTFPTGDYTMNGRLTNSVNNATAYRFGPTGALLGLSTNASYFSDNMTSTNGTTFPAIVTGKATLMVFQSGQVTFYANPSNVTAGNDTAPSLATLMQLTSGSLAIGGMTGATAAGRWVGTTASGAPGSGTFTAGDWITTQNGHMYVCTVGGSPGTWVEVGGVVSASGTTNQVTVTGTSAITLSIPSTFVAPGTISLGGLAGALSTVRWAGGTTSGAPNSGTFVTGDWVISQDGSIYICTVGGSPGTWIRGGTWLLGANNTWSGTNTFNGTINGSGILSLSNTGAHAVQGSFQAAMFWNVGQTGAATTSRWVGGTASGAPSSGTWAVGDFVVTQNGHIFICTSAGTPGTWVDAGSGGAVSSVAGRTGAVTLTAADIGAGTFPSGAFAFQGAVSGITTLGTTGIVTLNFSSPHIVYTDGSDTVKIGLATTAGQVSAFSQARDLVLAGPTRVFTPLPFVATGAITSGSTVTGTNIAPSGLTGATTASRYVGGTASVAPTTGTFNTGDHVVTQSGRIFICTAGGSPGTWIEAGSTTFYSASNPPPASKTPADRMYSLRAWR
jgi:hypothetical protein